MLLLIDNYDSFTYNLAHFLGELQADVVVRRNDALSVDEALALKPSHIVLSPGPKTPDQAGICLPLTKASADHCIPLLGVCLGHQSIGQAFGGKIVRHTEIFHGKTSEIHHDKTSLFRDLPSPLKATRYHSLVIEPASLPSCLVSMAHLDDGTIMGIRHRDLPLYGVQFHPESIRTEYGHALLKNFLDKA